MSNTVHSDVLLTSTLPELVVVAQRVAFYALLAGCLYFIGYVIYQLIYHPLARYPGPFLAKFSNAYCAYHAAKGDLHIDMWRCHEKYGKFVRYAPDRLLVDSAEAMKDVYGYGKNVTKSQVYMTMVHRAPNTLTMLDNKEHARRRRVMSSGFSNSQLRVYEPKVKAQTQKLCSLLKQDNGEKWSEPQNMAELSSYFAFDIMADLVFGVQYNLMENPKFRYVVDCIRKSNRRVSTVGQMQSLSFSRLDKHLFPVAIYARNRFIKFVTRCVMERMKTPNPTINKDVFTIFTDAKDPQTGSGFTPLEIAAESTTLIVAGSDTSAILLSSLFFYLSRNPTAYAKAALEVRSKFSSAEEISNINGQLNSCTYLRACIDETARITPPAGSALWREVLPGGAFVDGQYLPEACDVGTSVYSIHHNPKYFKNPFTFRPERWIAGESSPEEIELAQSAYAPFSFGPRGCIGKQLALSDLMMAMASVLFTFDFRMPDGPCAKVGAGRPDQEYGRHRPQEYQLRDHITGENEGPYIQFRRRVGAPSC